MKWQLLIALVITATPVTAQEIRFQGQSKGCFGVGCTPTTTAGVDYLNYTGNGFDGTTNNGDLALNFGYFTWDAFQGIDWMSSPFSLFLSFTKPTGIDPSPVFGGDAWGLIIKGTFYQHAINLSTTVLVFEPNVRTFNFTGGQPNAPGQFTLTLNDTYISATGRSYLTGNITDASLGMPATVTPEPLTITLLGTGLAGLGMARRRRKQQAQAQDA